MMEEVIRDECKKRFRLHMSIFIFPGNGIIGYNFLDNYIDTRSDIKIKLDLKKFNEESAIIEHEIIEKRRAKNVK